MKTEKKERVRRFKYRLKGMFFMINQQAYQNSFLGGMNIMENNKTKVESSNVKKSTYVDITQTKEFWSKLAVIS